MRKVFVLSAVRTPIGAFGGSLVDVGPADLGALVVKTALSRAAIAPEIEIDEVIMGNVLGAGHGMNIARQVALRAGLSASTPAYTVNKVCGSGLKSVALGTQAIALGDADCIVAGGTESMSQAGFVSLSQRWGSRMGNAELKDLMLSDGLTDAFHSCHMGITAENLAERYGVSREAQDAFAALSQSKAQQALSSGWFKDEVVPVPLMKKGKPAGEFSADEYPRAGVTVESLAGLRPAFKKEGTVTAGNASGINDGAAAVVLCSEDFVVRHGLKPMAEMVATASGAVAPEVMGIGPVEAVRKLMRKADLALSDVELIESNEAFAAQALSVDKELGWDTSRINVCGGAIALGHPIGASGTRILVTLLHQLRRTGKRLGLATLCVGGGQGVAVLVRA